MRCKEVRKELSALLDGELAPSAEKAVLHHIHTCGSCAVFHEELKRTKRALELNKVSEEADITGRITKALEKETPGKEALPGKPSFMTRRILRFQAAAAVLLVCAVGAFLIYGRTERKTPPKKPVEDTARIIGNLRSAFRKTGLGLQAAPENVASKLKAKWLAEASIPSGKGFFSTVSETGRLLPEGVSVVARALGDALDQPSSVQSFKAAN